MVKITDEMKLLIAIDSILLTLNTFELVNERNFILMKVIAGAVLIFYAWRTGLFE